MLQFKFLNLAKPKKLFQKLNKMGRKQAYTVGAVIVVAVVALMMLVSSLNNDGDPMEGMTPRGYDLASMPFINDEAEKMLLASYYPDMSENGSTFLYTPLERAQREEEDQENEDALEEAIYQSEEVASLQNTDSEDIDSNSTGNSGSGYGRNYGGGTGTGRSKTEIGRMEKGSMAAGSGSGIGATWGPSVDNRGLQGQSGYVAPAQVQQVDGRKALQQFRAGSIATARLRDNKMVNARKSMMGGNIPGSGAFGKDGIDASKLGGLALDTSELPSTTDLDNLDHAVDNAVKDQAKPEKPEDELGFWEQLGQDMLRQFATGLVDAVTTGVGDSLKGWINGNSASRSAGKQVWAEMQGTEWKALSASDQAIILKADPNAATTWGTKECKATYGNAGKYLSDVAVARHKGYAEGQGKSIGSTPSPSKNTSNDTQVGALDSGKCNEACQKQGKSGGTIVSGMCVCS